MLKKPGPSGFGYGSAAEEIVAGLDLSGKTYLITGCNSGIGQETMRVLARRGAHIVAAARTVEKAEKAGAEIGASVTPVACELSDPDSVRACVEEVARGPALDAIICNAGIMALPELEVKHRLELQFLTNHVGHFILVTGLLDHLTPAARLVIVSSNAHFKTYADAIQFDNLDGSKGYSGWSAYGQTKLANLLFARELARRVGPQQVANALHPGVIHTNLARNMNPLVDVGLAVLKPLALKSIPQGAATQTWAAAHPDVAKISGEYLADCNVATSSNKGIDMAMAERLWAETERIVADL